MDVICTEVLDFRHPLKPVAVQSVSSWTEYRTDRPQVLEFGSKVEMVDLPGYKEKQRMIDVLLPARKRRMEDEKSVDCPLKSQVGVNINTSQSDIS